MVAYTYSQQAPVFHAGWLHKESTSGFRKTFHKRWFVLEDSELKYYKSEEDSVPHGVIDLNDYSTVAHDASCKRSPFAFVLKPRSEKEHRSYLVFADSEEEMNKWMKTLQSCLGDRSVLDKWLERLDLSSPSFESSRTKSSSSTMSPTNSTFSKTSSEFEPRNKVVRGHKASSSVSSTDSTSSGSSVRSGVTAESDFDPHNRELARQQLKEKILRTSSMPPISRDLEPFRSSPIASAPNSPTFNDLAKRRNVNLPPLPPLKGMMFTMDSNGSPLPFLQAPPKVEKWETERARKRRSNSLSRFDCIKTGCITPTFGNATY